MAHKLMLELPKSLEHWSCFLCNASPPNVKKLNVKLFQHFKRQLHSQIAKQETGILPEKHKIYNLLKKGEHENEKTNKLTCRGAKHKPNHE